MSSMSPSCLDAEALHRSGWCLFIWVWRFPQDRGVSQAVLTSGSSSPERTEHVGLLHLAWSGRTSLPVCWPASLHRWTSLCIGRNQAAAVTSEQCGEITHWVETHSLERMRLIALLANPITWDDLTEAYPQSVFKNSGNDPYSALRILTWFFSLALPKEWQSHWMAFEQHPRWPGVL